MKRKRALTVIIPLVAWIALSVIRASSAGGSENPSAVHPDFNEAHEHWCEVLGCFVPTVKDCPNKVDGVDMVGSPVHARVRGNQVRMHLTLKEGDNINMQFKFFEGDTLIVLGPQSSIQIEIGKPGKASWTATPGNSMSGRFKVNEKVANTFRVKLIGVQRNSQRPKTVWRSPRITINYQ